MDALSPQSGWMGCSAPEMTTVSKPKRNPASADVTDQRRMRRFIQLFCLESPVVARTDSQPRCFAPIELAMNAPKVELQIQAVSFRRVSCGALSRQKKTNFFVDVTFKNSVNY